MNKLIDYNNTTLSPPSEDAVFPFFTFFMRRLFFSHFQSMIDMADTQVCT